MQRLVIATHNLKKAKEMAEVLSGLLPSLELLTLQDFPDAPEPDETGETYADNAKIKAISGARATGEWSLADDAGLEIDALWGQLGVHSKRFEGTETSFPEKMEIILKRMEGVPVEERAARFRCCVALSPPSGESVEVFEATCEGLIAHEQRGTNGFGYDPIFFVPEMGRHMAELTPEEKHSISHRGKVLRLLAEELSRRERA